MNPRSLTEDASVACKDFQLTAFPRIAGRRPLRNRFLPVNASAAEFWVVCAVTMMFLAAASAVSLRAIGAITAFH
jgi:hypothetical protein